jgi:hypothetical protein
MASPIDRRCPMPTHEPGGCLGRLSPVLLPPDRQRGERQGRPADTVSKEAPADMRAASGPHGDHDSGSWTRPEMQSVDDTIGENEGGRCNDPLTPPADSHGLIDGVDSARWR